MKGGGGAVSWYKMVNDWIERAGIQKSKLASVLGCSRPYLYPILSGRRPPPSPDQVLKLLDYFEEIIKPDPIESHIFIWQALQDKYPPALKPLYDELHLRVMDSFATDPKYSAHPDFQSKFKTFLLPSMTYPNSLYALRVIKSVERLPVSERGKMIAFIESLSQMPSTQIEGLMDQIK